MGGSGNLGRFISLDSLLPSRGEDGLEVPGEMQLSDGTGESHIGDVGLVAECAGQESLRP